MPATTAAGDILTYDIYYVSVPHVQDGQQCVVSFHDHYSTLNTPYLLARKSDAFTSIQHYIAYCKLHQVTVRRMHTDNAGDLTSKQIREFLLQQELGSPQSHQMCHDKTGRANGNGEQWPGREGKIGELETANFILVVPPKIIHRHILAPAAIREETIQTPSFRFTGVVPSCAGVRPIGCRVFPKIYLQPKKLSQQSIPCVYLGRARNQPGHMCLDPLTKLIYVSPHARFIETIFLGLNQHPPPATPNIPHIPAGAHPPTAPPSMSDDIINDDTDE
eukprot:5413650-Pleurochrysis_carterae.AAC.1